MAEETNADAYFPELALVEIAKKDDTTGGLNVTTQVSSWSESGFGRPVESDPYFGNAKVKYSQPQEDGEVSFDVSVTNAQWYRMFHGGEGTDFTSGSAQSDYRISVLVRDNNVSVGSGDPIDPDTAIASGSVWGTGNALRIIYADANLSSFEPELNADGYLQGTITFTLSPTDEKALGTVRIQEKLPDNPTTGSTYELTALGSYTSLVKW